MSKALTVLLVEGTVAEFVEANSDARDAGQPSKGALRESQSLTLVLKFTVPHNICCCTEWMDFRQENGNIGDRLGGAISVNSEVYRKFIVHVLSDVAERRMLDGRVLAREIHCRL